ncbi:MAG TPA: glycosyl hydrolase 53 family protein, partial [Phycisphaerae bacterium]|nr:glycosyl hydrolase 53 family protein [Phycisphaerae bacterium]
MNRRAFLKCLGLGAAIVAAPGAAPAQDDFLKGGDVSLLAKIERLGGVYRDAGKPKDALAIFKDHGANCMRLRLFHRPGGKGPVVNGLDYTVALGRRIKDSRLKLLLNFHYSDTWADPGHQAKPAAWRDLPFDRLEAAVFAYSRDTIAAFKKAGALPDIVQIGNEIAPGMLWDDGRVGGKFDTPEQWRQFGALLRAGVRGVKAPIGADERVRIMLHIHPGGSAKVTRWFFDGVLAQGVPFDLIGLSYYPWWHGSFDDLRDNLAATAKRFRKKIVVVETGFPWTTERFDPGGNVFGGEPERLKAAYPQTPAGQKAFLEEL